MELNFEEKRLLLTQAVFRNSVWSNDSAALNG